MESDGETLTVQGAGGQVELRVCFTESGPVLRFDAPSLMLSNSGDLSLRSRNLELCAQENLSVRVGGDLEQQVTGGAKLKVGEDLDISAQAASLRGRLGEVCLEANDDLVLNGERVLLNCPTEEEQARRQQAVKDLKDLLALNYHPPGTPRRLPRSAPVADPDAPAPPDRGEDEEKA